MATKPTRKHTANKGIERPRESHLTPKFPYTSRPNSLRRILRLIPDRPKPAKVNRETLKGWSLSSGEDATALRVLKAIDFIDAANAPTQKYQLFMDPRTGPAVLGVEVRRIYNTFFEHYHDPHKQADNDIKRLFNQFSGGSASVLSLQINTFKVLSEFAELSTPAVTTSNQPVLASQPNSAQADVSLIRSSAESANPILQINLHIHLPENKTARDYQAIFEDIATFIYGRKNVEE
jgi:hypothetical protein